MIQFISKGSIGEAIRIEIAQEMSDLKLEFNSLLTTSSETTTPSIQAEDATDLVNSTTLSTSMPITIPEVSNDIPSSKYDGIISRMSEKYNVPEQFIRSVIRAESDFNPNSLSSAGAMGLMQLMPETAKSVGVTDPYDPEQNIEGGTKLLKSYIDKYGDLKLVLAAYNAGPGAVAKYGGVPPYEETQNYIKKVLGNLA